MARAQIRVVALLCALTACGHAPSEALQRDAQGPAAAQVPTREAINPRLLRRFRPIARLGYATPPPSHARVDLGRMLYFDARLSETGLVSCNDCHRLDSYGVDGRATSLGVYGRRGRRNAPTVLNAAEHFAQFWDGRARDQAEQVMGPLLGPSEMAGTREAIESTLRVIPGYRAAFAQAFPGELEPVTLENVALAIAAFERGLVTRSRWDDYLAGDTHALTPAEIHGLRVFLDVGCTGCHTGPQVGASMFQVAGFVEPWENQSDQGRFEITHQEADRMAFKVPTLKNIAHTAPYFHDGSCATLPVAIHTMGVHQLGIDLSDDEVASIATFLDALTGEVPADYVARPALPQEAP